MKRAGLVAIIALLSSGVCLGGEQPLKAGRPKDNVKKADKEKNLEPYLKESFPDLVAQIASDSTPSIIQRRAMERLVARYPDKAPDALVRYLDQPGGHLNEYTGRLLFQLGKPISNTDELIGRIAEYPKWNMAYTVAFAQALSWPGNNAAIPVLQKMIDEKWAWANEIRLCIARIQDTKGPAALLKLPDYAGDLVRNEKGVNYAQRVGRLLRATADPRANEILLKGGSPAKASGLWEARGLYALAWPGNVPLADAFLKAQNPYTRFHIAAARTRDERCLKVIRGRFEKEAARLLATKPSRRNLFGFRWMLIAGVESANAETAPTLIKLLKMIEERREAAEAALKVLIELGDPIRLRRNGDPAGHLREIILRGLCIRPNPEVRAIVKPYLADDRRAYLVGLAMLRAGHAEGIQYVWNHWSKYPSGSDGRRAAETFLVYTAADVLPHNSGHAPGSENINKAKAWCEKHKDSKSFRDRIALINKSGLSDTLVEPLKLWP